MTGIVPLLILGGIVLVAVGILSFVKTRRDHKPYREEIGYDPDTQYAVIRSSICTGEKVAGFRNKTDGHFTEVMLIRDPEDEKRFMEAYGLDSVKVEY
jgi:hypothetical protein